VSLVPIDRLERRMDEELRKLDATPPDGRSNAG
jgi:hypothetical protein